MQQCWCVLAIGRVQETADKSKDDVPHWLGGIQSVLKHVTHMYESCFSSLGYYQEQPAAWGDVVRVASRLVLAQEELGRLLCTPA